MSHLALGVKKHDPRPPATRERFNVVLIFQRLQCCHRTQARDCTSAAPLDALDYELAFARNDPEGARHMYKGEVDCTLTILCFPDGTNFSRNFNIHFN